jgi:DNA-binding LacI/PurR family transcriptional regulator
MVVNMSRSDGQDMMRSLARAGVRIFLVHGNTHFPYEVLEDRLFDDVWIFSVLDWVGPERRNLLRVLSDFRAGGRRAARHLWEKGHRRAVVVATDLSLYGIGREEECPGLDAASNTSVAFIHEWERLGGSYRTLRSHTESEGNDTRVWLEEGEFLEVFDGSGQMPTGVFGFRDVEAARVQQGIRRWRPEIEEEVDIVGYYDTPWSRAAHPPIDTVSLRLDRIAGHVAELIEMVLKGQRIDNPTRLVEPELIQR